MAEQRTFNPWDVVSITTGRTMEDKRLEQKKETWIKNVMRIEGLTREEAERLYDKLRPFEEDRPS